MATTDKTFALTASAEGLVDTGNTPHILFAFDTDHVEFTSSKKSMTAVVEVARKTSALDTWEDWGVPAGATVDSISITDWDYRITNDSDSVTAGNCTLDVVDGSDVVVTDTAILDAILETTAVGWTANGDSATDRTVKTSHNSSSQAVSLRMTETLSSNSGTVVWSFDVKNVDLEITYTEAVRRVFVSSSILALLGTLGAVGQFLAYRKRRQHVNTKIF